MRLQMETSTTAFFIICLIKTQDFFLEVALAHLPKENAGAKTIMLYWWKFRYFFKRYFVKPPRREFFGLCGFSCIDV
jgi:hypothetical protein